MDRKLVKQTVMTSVYGVTFVGAREQIKRRLEEKGHITDDRVLFSAACYTAKVSNPFNIMHFCMHKRMHVQSVIISVLQIHATGFVCTCIHLDFSLSNCSQIPFLLSIS